MTSPAFAGHPFGTAVTEETLKKTFGPLTQWEDKYRQLIMLGKQLPPLSEELKAQAREIPGCETGSGWVIRARQRGKCTSLVTVRGASYAACWRFC